ncbi:MAG: CBS domain-containing protein [Dehalococcoidia bacterium]
MQTQRANIVICPSCGAENIEGVDTCENCMQDLRTLDVPDTFQVASESDLTRRLDEIRLSKPQVVAPSTSVREVLALLRADPAGAVVVVEEERIVGIFTDRDVLKRVAGQPGALDEPVFKYMTPDPVTLRDDDTMAVALNKMGDGGFRHIPMLREGRLTAIVTVRDIMHWLLGQYFDQSRASDSR